jgi:predicted aspartyl protease
MVMGLTTLQIELANFRKSGKWESIELLVDSGAIYSVIPATVLRRLDVRSEGKEEFVLADGSRIIRRKGIAKFRYQGRVGGSDVIFGEPGDSTLLGALTLEALGLSLDPLRRELKQLPMILGGWRPEKPRPRRRAA